MYRIAAGVSLSGYVRSMAGLIFPVSTSSRRAIRSSALSEEMKVPSFWLTSGDNSWARRWRSVPPSHRAGPAAKVIVRVDLAALLRGYPTAGETCELVGFGPV